MNQRSDRPTLGIPGVTGRVVRGDGLHIVFTKGILAHLLGSILHDMCWREPPGRTQKEAPWERLAIIFKQVQTVYKERQAPTRLTNLKLAVFTGPQKPHKSHDFLGVQGAEAKHLAPALLVVCQKVLGTGNSAEQYMVTALKRVVGLIALFDEADIFCHQKSTRKP